MTKSEDGLLFERWLTSRDGDAFAELARRHASTVYDIAARTLGDRTAAEDVVQEALLDLALTPTRKPVEVGVVAWLVRFAICRARNQRSAERSRARRQEVVGLRRPEECMPDEDFVRKDELEHALATAEPEERAILAMRYLHGWDYGRIAQALDITEGAVRVRVHRALVSVRARVASNGVGAGCDADSESRVVRGLAALPIAALPAARIDEVIRAALDAAAAAPVPASHAGPVSGNRIGAALRAGLPALGVVLLLAGAATSTVALRAAADPVSERECAAAVGAGTMSVPSVAASARTGSASGVHAFGSPRPENWDGGALARLARGELGLADANLARGASRPVLTPPPVERDLDGEVAGAKAPAAVPAPEDPSAFRPSPRIASAANCDSGSPGGERADALGGSVRSAATQEPALQERSPDLSGEAAAAPQLVVSPADESAAPRRRFVSRPLTLDGLDPAHRALVEEAAKLVRAVMAGTTDPGNESLREGTSGARVLRKQYHAFRRTSRQAAAESGAPELNTRKVAKMDRVLAALADFALDRSLEDGAPADGRLPDGRFVRELRWPTGVDVAAALEEVIRVLSGIPQRNPSRIPDIVAHEAQSGAQPESSPATASELP